MVQKCLIVFLLLSLGLPSLNQSKENVPANTIKDERIRDYVYTGFVHLYNFEFHSADSIIDFLKSNYSYSPWTYVLSSNYYWWKIISGEKNESNAKLFLKNLAYSRDRIGKERSHENLFLRILISSFRSRYDLLDDKYISTVNEVKNQIDVIKNTFGKEEQYQAFYLTSGLYYYMVDIAYTNYLFLRPLLYFIPEGDRAKGIRYLSKKTGDIILETESNYYLMKIYNEMESNGQQSLKYAKYLYSIYPNNYVFAEYYFRLLIKTRKTPLTKQESELLIKSMNKNKQLTTNQKEYFSGIIIKLQELQP